LRFFHRPKFHALVVGLGNPGPSYARTRHNVGFRAIEALAARRGARSWRSKFRARVAQLMDDGAILAMPQKFMNESGASVAPLAGYYRLKAAQVLVVCDDINLEFGQLRLRRKGSDGGHNGLRDIIEALHSSEFPRLRIGVGRSEPDAIDVVLGSFSADEEERLGAIIDRAVDGVEAFVQGGIDAAIAKVNAAGGRGADAEEQDAGA